MNHLSPLRYPGGKSVMYNILKPEIRRLKLEGCIYAEPYAGGAGAALKLLHEGVVSEIYINDIDQSIFAFWYSILYHTDEFIELIEGAKLTISEWLEMRDIFQAGDYSSTLEQGYVCFYLNRSNRSGILKAGVIGGLKQSSEYSQSCRFNKETLIQRIRLISTFRDRIKVYNMDALDFLDNVVNNTVSRVPFFAYIDPPYYKKGYQLYTNYYKHEDHEDLANYLRNKSLFKWILSYDDVDEVRQLYHDFKFSPMVISYSLSKNRKGLELLIQP